MLKFSCQILLNFGRLAQLVRAPGLHPGGWGFESLSGHTPAKRGITKFQAPITKQFSMTKFQFPNKF